MPAKGPVSIKWQTIFCFIPIMDMVASYRVKRLRWYLLIFVIFSIASSAVQSVVNPFDETEMYNERVFSEDTGFDWEYAMLGSDPEMSVASYVIHLGITYAIAVYLVRRWSKRWNLEFA